MFRLLLLLFLKNNTAHIGISRNARFIMQHNIHIMKKILHLLVERGRQEDFLKRKKCAGAKTLPTSIKGKGAPRAY